MKFTSCLFATLLALFIAPAHGRQQASQLNESLAYSRMIAAHSLPNSVTHGQCSSAAADWLERDKADKDGGPYWFQRLSTEELYRMVSLSAACGTHEGAASIGMFSLRNAQFQNILLNRAETVLHNHGLVEEYLLQP